MMSLMHDEIKLVAAGHPSADRRRLRMSISIATMHLLRYIDMCAMNVFTDSVRSLPHKTSADKTIFNLLKI
jgi:hypothetical protein